MNLVCPDFRTRQPPVSSKGVFFFSFLEVLGGMKVEDLRGCCLWKVESHNHGTGVYLPYEQPVPLPGFGWLSLLVWKGLLHGVLGLRILQ